MIGRGVAFKRLDLFREMFENVNHGKLCASVRLWHLFSLKSFSALDSSYIVQWDRLNSATLAHQEFKISSVKCNESPT